MVLETQFHNWKERMQENGNNICCCLDGMLSTVNQCGLQPESLFSPCWECQQHRVPLAYVPLHKAHADLSPSSLIQKIQNKEILILYSWNCWFQSQGALCFCCGGGGNGGVFFLFGLFCLFVLFSVYFFLKPSLIELGTVVFLQCIGRNNGTLIIKSQYIFRQCLKANSDVLKMSSCTPCWS